MTADIDQEEIKGDLQDGMLYYYQSQAPMQDAQIEAQLVLLGQVWKRIKYKELNVLLRPDELTVFLKPNDQEF